MTHRLRASDPISYRKPSACAKKLWLREQGEVKEAEADDFTQALAKLGTEHENYHLDHDLPDHLDLSKIKDRQERVAKTKKALEDGSTVLFQAELRAETELAGRAVEVVGMPDFVLPTGSGEHVIRDAKLARTIDEDREDILLQLQIYGWLYEQTMGRPPSALEVFNGRREIVSFSYAGGGDGLDELTRILDFRLAPEEPNEPVGWSKCSGCGFFDHCWPEAERNKSLGLVPQFDQGMVKELNSLGITSYEEVPSRFDRSEMAEVRRPWGDTTQRFGPKRAAVALAQIDALMTGKPALLERLQVPDAPSYVMFDLEGLPPDTEGPEQIYLWGLQIFHRDGSDPEPFLPSIAGFHEEGDEQAWEEFLANSQKLLEQYGEGIQFVHWAPYEKSKMNLYIEKFGDRNGLAEQLIKNNLLDLYGKTRKAVALPIPSLSLKVVEKFVGYERQLAGYAGDKSIARYMQAVETNDEDLREEIVDELCKYNQEDLEATWAVMQWLMAFDKEERDE